MDTAARWHAVSKGTVQFMTTMNTFPPATRRLLSLAALSVASLAWGQDAPAPAAGSTLGAATSSPAAASPAPAAPAPGADRILPAADPNTPVGTTLAGILSGNSTAVSAIQRQEFATRDQLLSEISDRLQIGERRIAELQQSSGSLDETGKRAMEMAVTEYNNTKAKLQQSIDAARSAESNTWERTRSSLASNYAFWVSAAASVELAAPK